MAEAKKCDRCGQFYDFYSKIVTIDRCNHKVNGFRYTFGNSNIIVNKDLCPDCLQKLFEFMNERGQ